MNHKIKSITLDQDKLMEAMAKAKKELNIPDLKEAVFVRWLIRRYLEEK